MRFPVFILLILGSQSVIARLSEHRRADGITVPPVLPSSASNTESASSTGTQTSTSNTIDTSSTSSTPVTSPPPAPTSTAESSTSSLSSDTPSSQNSQTSSAESSQTQSSSIGQSTSTITVTSSDSSSTSSSTSPAPSVTDTNGDDNNSSVGTGTIVGLSVAGGIAVLGAVAFIVWKFTRKRFSEFDADGEEIKWPELGHESHALPTRPTGRVGVDDDGFDDAGVAGAGRHLAGYTPSTTTGEASMADLHAYNDPYAVPPLPHLDPNQPYRDDPASYGGHYDPYQGPVPQAFHDPAIPERTGTSSPAPANFGRESPGPSLSYTRY